MCVPGKLQFSYIVISATIYSKSSGYIDCLFVACVCLFVVSVACIDDVFAIQSKFWLSENQKSSSRTRSEIFLNPNFHLWM